jgi:hypothetical protein
MAGELQGLTGMRVALLALLLVTPALSQSEFDKAVEAFRVRSRELGLVADAPGQARVRPRSRLSDYHGRLFWNIRNDAFDSVPHEVRQTGGDKGMLRRNQYGFSISGPVVIPKLYNGTNRTFVTVTFEGVKESKGRSFLETIATGAERTGDFSRTVDKAGQTLRLYDPASTRENPAFNPEQEISESNLQYLRDPFPGNRIPAGRLDPVASDAIGLYPAPNIAIGPYFQNNYTIFTPERNNANGLRAKVDHAIGDRQRLSVGFNYSNGLQGPAKIYDSIATPSGDDRNRKTRQLEVAHTYTISPNSVHSFEFQVGRDLWGTQSDFETGVFPRFSFEPYLQMGRSHAVWRSADTEFEIEDGVTFRKGSHSITVEGSVQFGLENDKEPVYPAGYFQFGEGLTSLPGIVNTGHSFASFMLGLSREAEGSLVEHPSYWRQIEWDIGFRDEWEVRKGLTLSFGVDLDVSRPRWEKFDRQSTVDLQPLNPENGLPGALVFANRDGYGRSFQQTRRRLQPYVSVAWNPFDGDATVIRGSFFRRLDGYGLGDGHDGTQGFNGTPTYITQNDQLEPAVILRDGLPAPPIPPPDLRPEAANDTDAFLLDLSGRTPVRHYYRFSIERQLGSSLVVAGTARYSHGWNQESSSRGAAPNAISLDALGYRDMLNDDEFNRSLRPYPQYRTFDVDDYMVGKYRESEFEMRVEKRTSAGLSLRFSYEFSRMMDNFRTRDGLQDYYNREKEWALAYYDHPHSFSLRYMYELPFGAGKPYLSGGGWGSAMLGGWSISGSASYASGDPIALRAQFNNTGNVVNALYVEAVPGVDPHVPDRGPESWFNPEAFVNPADFTIGNVSRAHPTLRNPRWQNHDLALAKRFRLTAERELEFNGTALNFVNHANWNEPDSEIGTVESPNTNAGRIVGSRGGRVIQLGVRFSF